MRKKLIAANWKMNKTFSEVERFIADFDHKTATKHSLSDVLICPPALYLSLLHEFYSKLGVSVGAQDISAQESGAFTGEISAQMLDSISVKYAIVGHSERRMYWNETDELIAKKVLQALSHGIIPVYCCGEHLAERNENKHKQVVEKQIHTALFHLTSEQLLQTIIAYEPVWAIGTGVTATIEQASEMHGYIRSLIGDKFGEEVAQQIRILYGGSCNSSNARALFSCEDIDGGLVGGASLQPDEFLKIIQAASNEQ
jgi:triosephosphate isomerase (TIM)